MGLAFYAPLAQHPFMNGLGGGGREGLERRKKKREGDLFSVFGSLALELVVCVYLSPYGWVLRLLGRKRS